MTATTPLRLHRPEVPTKARQAALDRLNYKKSVRLRLRQRRLYKLPFVPIRSHSRPRRFPYNPRMDAAEPDQSSQDDDTPVGFPPLPTVGAEFALSHPKTTTVFAHNPFNRARRMHTWRRRWHLFPPLDLPRKLFQDRPFFPAWRPGYVPQPEGPIDESIMEYVEERMLRLDKQRMEAINAIMRGKPAVIRQYTLANELAYVTSVFKWFISRCSAETVRLLPLVRRYKIYSYRRSGHPLAIEPQRLQPFPRIAKERQVLGSRDLHKYPEELRLVQEVERIVRSDPWGPQYEVPKSAYPRLRWRMRFKAVRALPRMCETVDYLLTWPYRPYEGPPDRMTPDEVKAEEFALMGGRYFTSTTPYHYEVYGIPEVFPAVVKAVPRLDPSRERRPQLATWLICSISPNIVSYAGDEEGTMFCYKDLHHESYLDYEDYTYNDPYSRDFEEPYGSYYEYDRPKEPITDFRFIYTPMLAVLRGRCLKSPNDKPYRAERMLPLHFALRRRSIPFRPPRAVLSQYRKGRLSRPVTRYVAHVVEVVAEKKTKKSRKLASPVKVRKRKKKASTEDDIDGISPVKVRKRKKKASTEDGLEGIDGISPVNTSK